MKRFNLFLTAALGISLAAMAAPARAGDNDGQADLDKAMEKKLSATTTEDLGEVLTLSEGAIKKGLSATNLQFANDLVNSTLLQRGTFFTQRLFEGKSPPGGQMKDREMALADLEKLVGRDPKEGPAFLMIARLQSLRKQDHDAALKAANKAIELIKDEPNLQAAALVVRAGLQTDPDKELADFDAAIKIVPTDSEALWGRALLLINKNKLEPALADLDALVKQIPKNIDDENIPARVRAVNIYETRGALLFELKRTDQAIASYEESIKLQPNSPTPYINRALARAEFKDTKGALEDLEKALALDPDSKAVLLARARVYQYAKDLKNARADVDTVLKSNNDPEETMKALELRASIAAEEKDYDQAIKDLEALEKFLPKKDAELLLQIGRLYAVAKHSRKAIEEYDAALAVSDNPWLVYRVRGDAYLNIGKQVEAIRDYEKAIQAYDKSKTKADDDHAGLLNNLAWILATSPDAKLRDAKRSIELGTKACEETKYKEAYILSTLAAGYAEKGDFDSAAKWSQKAVEAVGPADKEMKPELEKELKSYQDKKPWREMLNEDEQPKPKDAAKPDGVKPDSAKPDSGKTPSEKSTPEKSADGK